MPRIAKICRWFVLVLAAGGAGFVGAGFSKGGNIIAIIIGTAVGFSIIWVPYWVATNLFVEDQNETHSH